MNGFFNTLFDLLRLRAGPQDLPTARILTVLVLAVYFGHIIITAQHLGEGTGVARGVFAALFQFSAVAVLLKLRGHSERLEQTLLAFASTGTVLGLLAFAFLIQADPNVDQYGLAMVWFAIFGWSLAVDANIFRHALAVALPIGMLITVIILALSYSLLELVFR